MNWQVRILSFSGAAMPQLMVSIEILEKGKMYTVTLMMCTNDISRGESQKMMRLQDKVSCILLRSNGARDLYSSLQHDGRSESDEHE